jgi:hypothetical protein
MALETNSEAKLPVYLSLCKLYARSLWHTLKGGNQKNLVLWGKLFLGDDDDDETWYAGKARDQWLSRWKKGKPTTFEDKDTLHLDGHEDSKPDHFDDVRAPLHWFPDFT